MAKSQNKRFFITAAAVFGFTFIFDWIYHSIIMMPMYKATSQVWRSPEEMDDTYLWLIVHQVLLALLLTYIFTQNYEKKGLNEGVRYGLYVGGLIGIVNSMSYAWLPIPSTLAIAWFIGAVAYGVGVGLVLAQTYKKLW